MQNHLSLTWMSFIWSEWLPSSSTAPASARDSSRRYSFTPVLPFLHHYSPWLHVGVLVKHRLLGMTGGEVAVLLPRYCATPHDCFSSTVILRERLQFAATEESPPHTHLTIAINCFLFSLGQVAQPTYKKKNKKKWAAKKILIDTTYSRRETDSWVLYFRIPTKDS